MKTDKELEEIFATQFKGLMVVNDVEGFKRTYPTLYKAIMKSLRMASITPEDRKAWQDELKSIL